MTCSYVRITSVTQSASKGDLHPKSCRNLLSFYPTGVGHKFGHGCKLPAECAMDPSRRKCERIVKEHDILISITQPVLHQASREAVLSGTPNNIQSDLRDSQAAPLIPDFLSLLTHFTDFFLGKKPHQTPREQIQGPSLS